MECFRRPLFAAVVAIACALIAAPSYSQSAAREVHVTGIQNDDLYLARARVSIDADVRGDVNAAGGRVRIGGSITGDVGAGGGLVTVVGAVGDDVRVGGGQVDIDTKIGGDLVAGAFSVGIQPGTVVGGKAILSGGEVSVAGRIDGDLSIAGDVEIAGGEADILPGARIGGNLSYVAGREARIAAGAVIEGEITRRMRDPGTGDESTSVAWLVGGGFSVAWLVGLVATGTILMIIFPESLGTATRSIEKAAWRSSATACSRSFRSRRRSFFALSLSLVSRWL